MNAPTIIPTSYPELEAEAYAAIYPPDERPTEVPPPAEQLGLQVDCFLGFTASTELPY